MKSTESLAYPLEFFQYEHNDIKQMFYQEYSWLFEKKQFAHLGGPVIEQEVLEKNFPILSNSIRHVIYDDDRFFGKFFLTHPRSIGDLHIDLRQDQKTIRDWSLNIPIENCQDTYQEWYDTHDDPYTESAFYALFWRNYNSGTLIYKYELITPTILKVSIPHRINNPLNNYRIVMGIRTLNNRFKHNGI
jgi:hypothetical protein